MRESCVSEATKSFRPSSLDWRSRRQPQHSLAATEDLACLRLAPRGCSSLKDRFSCLSSKNATQVRRFQVSGGVPYGRTPASGVVGHVSLAAAHVSPPTRCWCRPRDMVSSPELCLKAPLVLSLETPRCVNGAAEVFAKPSLQRPNEAQLSRLSAVTEGCMSLKAQLS